MSTPGSPKTLIIASGRDHVDINDFGSTAIKDAEITELATGGLARQNAITFSPEPWLAQELPSQDRGTWIINSDGTMATTYKLRPNLKWHDGTPLRSDSFVLGWRLARDPGWSYFNPQAVQVIERIETPDDQTLVIHWRNTFNAADKLYRTSLPPLPEHILGPFVDDLEGFRNHPIWTTSAFVGNGPFKIVRWEAGNEMEFVAFEEYALGRPKIDRIMWRFITDLNTLLSNVLSDKIDVAMRQSFTVDTGLVAKSQWESSGAGSVVFTPVSMHRVTLSALNPWLTDVRVHRGLLHAIDREAVSETVSQGLEPVAHIPLVPSQPEFRDASQAATRYDYDPQRARQLLAEAGWSAGPDGVLVNATGERFSIDGQTLRQQQYEQLQTITSDYWKRVGVEVRVNNLSARELSAPEYRGQFTGAQWLDQVLPVDLWNAWYSNVRIPRPENTWSGGNTARWDDPAKEAVLLELGQTLDKPRASALIVEFVRLYMDRLPSLPLKYEAEVMAIRKGVTNLHPRPMIGAYNTRTWNAEQWDRSG